MNEEMNEHQVIGRDGEVDGHRVENDVLPCSPDDDEISKHQHQQLPSQQRNHHQLVQVQQLEDVDPRGRHPRNRHESEEEPVMDDDEVEVNNIPANDGTIGGRNNDSSKSEQLTAEIPPPPAPPPQSPPLRSPMSSSPRRRTRSPLQKQAKSPRNLSPGSRSPHRRNGRARSPQQNGGVRPSRSSPPLPPGTQSSTQNRTTSKSPRSSPPPPPEPATMSSSRRHNRSPRSPPTPMSPVPPPPAAGSLQAVSPRQILLTQNEVLAMTGGSQKRLSDMTDESSIMRCSIDHSDIMNDTTTTLNTNEDHITGSKHNQLHGVLHPYHREASCEDNVTNDTALADESAALRMAIEESRLSRERSRQILHLTRNSKHRFSDLTTDSSLMFTTVAEEMEGTEHQYLNANADVDDDIETYDNPSITMSSVGDGRDGEDNSDMISECCAGDESTESYNNVSQRLDTRCGGDSDLNEAATDQDTCSQNVSTKRWSDLTDDSSILFKIATGEEEGTGETGIMDDTIDGNSTINTDKESPRRTLAGGKNKKPLPSPSTTIVASAARPSPTKAAAAAKRSSALLYDPNLSEELREKSRQILRWTNSKKRWSDVTSESIPLTDIVEGRSTNTGSSSDITGTSSSLAVSSGYASIISTDDQQQEANPTNFSSKHPGEGKQVGDDLHKKPAGLQSNIPSKELSETPKITNSKGSASTKLNGQNHSKLRQEATIKDSSASIASSAGSKLGGEFEDGKGEDEKEKEGRSRSRREEERDCGVGQSVSVGVLREPPRSLSLQSSPRGDTKPRRTAVTVRLPNGEFSTEGIHPGAIAIGGIAGADTGRSEHSIQVSMRSLRTSNGNNSSVRNNLNNSSSSSNNLNNSDGTFDRSQRTVTATAISEDDLVQEIFRRYTSSVIYSDETELHRNTQAQHSDQLQSCTASSVMVSEAEIGGDVTSSSVAGVESDELVSCSAVLDDSDRGGGGGGLLSAASRRRVQNKVKSLLFLVAALAICCCTLGAIIIFVVSQNGKDGGSSPTVASSGDVAGSDDSSPAEPPKPLRPTLQMIHDRGYLKCRGESFDVNQGFGMSFDLCSAIAAAVLGDPMKYEVLGFPFREQFLAISNGTVDISTSQTTPTMLRDVLEPISHQGVSFSIPYFYSGTTFFGIPEYVDCADRGDTLVGDCRFLSVCVLDGSVQADYVGQYLVGSTIHPVSDTLGLFEHLADGTCNVIPAAPLTIHEQRALLEDAGYGVDTQYVIAPRLHELDPLALTTRDGDSEFSDLVNWVLRALLVAEKHNITQDSADLFPTTDLFGDEYNNLFQDAIGAAGNYGEIYSRHWETMVPRPKQSINTLHIHSLDGGLLYANPLGKIDVFDGTATLKPNGTMHTVNLRQQLYCGIHIGRPGLADWNESSSNWSGIDVDFCRGLAAALFAGLVEHHLILIPFTSLDDGFVALTHGALDVLSGAVYNIENDVREPRTGKGFAFGDVYYYHENLNGEGDDVSTLAIATREDDSQWTDFVRSIVTSTIHAEANGVSQATAEDMPIMELFGPLYRQALRDVILSVGNYAELYERNMEIYFPRNQTRNMLNAGSTPLFFANWNFD